MRLEIINQITSFLYIRLNKIWSKNLILKTKFHLNYWYYNDKYVIISKHKDNEHYSLINLIRVITRANKRT